MKDKNYYCYECGAELDEDLDNVDDELCRWHDPAILDMWDCCKELDFNEYQDMEYEDDMWESLEEKKEE